MAVFDGHGPQGHFISGFLKLFFAEYFSRSELYKQDNKLVIPSVNKAFKNCFSELTASFGLDFFNSFKGNLNGMSSNYSGNANLEAIISKEINNNLNSIHSNNINYLMSSTIHNNNTNLFNTTNYSTTNTKNFYIKNNNNNTQTNPSNISQKTSLPKKPTLTSTTQNKKNSSLSISAQKNFPYLNLSSENHSLIKTSFSLAESIISNSKLDSNFSGSTSICVFILENRIICANCGDSRAILVARDPTNKNLNYVIPLSKDHKPDLPAEADRILGCNGRIDKRSENGIKTGPLRVWLRNEAFPGLAMSRSIGDLVASKIGVSCEPQVFEVELNDESLFIVLATDGVWEVLGNEEVAGIVSKYYENLDVESATEKLVEEAAKRWKNVRFSFLLSFSLFFFSL